MDWYMQLPPEQQAAIQGLAVMALFAVIKAICYWAKRPLSDTAAAKVTKLLGVAVATSLTTLATTGATTAFWPQWFGALVAAVGSWELLSKGYGLTAAAKPKH